MNKQKGFVCPKSGIKIHETKNNNEKRNTINQNKIIKNRNNINNEKYENKNMLLNLNYKKKSNLKEPVNFYNTHINNLDLNIENYSLEDLFNLFSIEDGILNEINLKNAKNIALKMHPDKSQLDPKYFLFFSKAYKELYNCYEFMNKSNNKKQNYEEYYDENNKVLLDEFLDKTNKKDQKEFNKWFNEQFEKNNIDNNLEKGYGNWLNSNEDIYEVNETNISKSNLNELFEKQKKQIVSLIEYKGIEENYLSSLGGSLLDGNNNSYSNNSLFNDDGLNYSDLKQAHQESIIPISNNVYEKIPKYRNVNEYQNARDSIDLTPMDEKNSLNYFSQRSNNDDKKSMELAFRYAREGELIKKKQEEFWGSIKRITF